MVSEEVDFNGIESPILRIGAYVPRTVCTKEVWRGHQNDARKQVITWIMGT